MYLKLTINSSILHIFKSEKIILKGKVNLVVQKMTMLTWSTMANSQLRIVINDSYTITREKWKCQCEIVRQYDI